MLLALLAQITPVQPLPKGTGLPPAADTQAETQAVLATVTRMLSALETSDPAIIVATTRPEGGATAAIEQADGTRRIRHLSWTEFAAVLKPDGNRYNEPITDPAVEVDGDIAMVWAPFTVRKAGALSHCGYDHFDLVREGGQWKILNITWSQRTTGCDAR